MTVKFASYNQDPNHPQLVLNLGDKQLDRVFDFFSGAYAQGVVDLINGRVEELIKEAVDAKEKEMKPQQSGKVSFTVDKIIALAKYGSDALREAWRENPNLHPWKGIIPGSESETFDDIENALWEKFPDGIILDDIS